MWQCRSPRMSSSSTSSRQPAPPSSAPPRARRGSRAARARCRRGRAARRPPASVAQVWRAAGRVVEHPVLGDVQPAAHRRFAQRRVVGARAGEVLQQVAELRGLGDPQIDRRARVGAARGAGACRRSRRCSICSSSPRRFAARRASVVTAIRSMSLTLSAMPARRAGELHVRARAAALGRPATSASPSSSARGSSSASARALGAAAVRCERREHALLELRAEPAHACAGAAPAPPRAAPPASRCRARRAAAARAWARGPAGG